MLDKLRKVNGPPEFGLGIGDEPRSQQGVTTEIEEVRVNIHDVGTQYGRPQVSQPLLSGAAGRLPD